MDIDRIVSEMTLEEKVSIIVGVGMLFIEGNPKPKVKGAAGETAEIPRLGIPRTVYADGPAGLRIDTTRENDERAYYATSFPIESMLSSTWNRELVEEVGKAMGEEVKEYGVDVFLAPAMNIHRNPLGGRNFEYFSEDPLLTGEMASAYVKGVQSNDVGACVKHFIANEQETNRMTVDTIVSERALREIYLKGFEIAIKKAKPWTVMSSYNKLNGTHTSQNKWLLEKVLREEWEFDGFVMSDWFAGDNPVEQVLAGNDLIMPGKSWQFIKEKPDEYETVLKAAKEGKIPIEVIDRNVKRILKVMQKMPSFKGYQYSNNPDLEAHSKIAKRAGLEGVVLLKNVQALPVTKETKIAPFGYTFVRTFRGGWGSGETYPRYTISFAEGLLEKGAKVDEKLLGIYKEHYEKRKAENVNEIEVKFFEDIFTVEEIENYAKTNDIAFITIGRMSGEGRDRKAEKGDFYLSDDETALLEKVSRIFHKYGKKIVVLLNIIGPIEIESWKEKVDAIVLTWHGGQETGKILADILLGEVSPSGKLPTTFPKDYKDVPSWTFPGEPADNPASVTYEEDIFVGYRYYDTFGVEPAFEFGYGLSYTEFEYSNPSISFDGEKVAVEVTVRNVGKFKGKEVVQVYVKAPKVQIVKPLQELKGFEKTKELLPGESERVKIEIPVKALASFGFGKWIVEPGKYEFRISASSRDHRAKAYLDLERMEFDV